MVRNLTKIKYIGFLYLLFLSLGSFSQIPLYWVSSVTSGNWGTASNWSITDGGSPGTSVPGINNIAVFSNVATATVDFSSLAVGQLSIVGSNVIFSKTGAIGTISVGGANLSGDDLQIINSNVTIAGATSPTTILLNTVLGTNTGLVSNSKLTVNNNCNIGLTSLANFTIDGIYVHASSTSSGYVPSATWATNSTCSITGITGPVVTNGNFNQNFYNFTWDSPGQTTSQTLLLAGGATINVANNFSVLRTGSASLNFNNGVVTVNGLIGNYIQGSGTVYSTSNNSANSATFLQISGNFTQSGGTFGNNNNGWMNVTFTGGSSNLSASGSIVGNTPITIFKSAVSNDVTLGSQIVIPNTLQIIRGNISTGANLLYQTVTGTSLTGASASAGWIKGNLVKAVPTGSNVRIYELGDNTNYLPVSLTFTGVTTGGNVLVNSIATDHPQISSVCINPALSINRYWTVTNAGTALTPINYAFSTSYLPTDPDGSFDITLSSGYVYNGSTWNAITTTSNNTATSVSFTGIRNLGSLQVGQSNLGNIGAVSGPLIVCLPSSNLTYSVSGVANATSYNWTIPSIFTIVSGAGTNSITVSVSGFSTVTGVSVAALNACSATSISGLTITVNSNNLNPVYISNGLSLSYLLNGNANDNSTSANNGVVSGSPGYTTDRFGVSNAAVLFNNSAQNISNTSVVNNISDFTLSVWIRTNTNTGGWIVGRQNGGSNDRKIIMNDNGFVRFGIYNGGIVTIASNSALNDNQWHHILAVHSATTGISLYIDGTLNSTSAVVSSDGNSGNWVLGNGSNWGGANGSTSANFNGIVDEFTYYNRTLTSLEVSQLYANNYIIDNTPICLGSNLILNLGSVSGANYAWSGPNGFSSTSLQNTISGVSAANNGTYTVSVGYGGCTFPLISKAISIGTGLTNTITGAQNVCVGNTPINALSGTAIPANASYLYLWLTSTVSGSAGFSGAFGTNTTSGYTFTNAINNNTWVTRVISINGCSFGSNTLLMTATSANLSEPNTYPSGYWNAYSYYQPSFLSTAYAGYWTIGGLNFDTRNNVTGYGNAAGTLTTGYPSNAPNYVGCQTNNVNYSIRFRGQNLVTATGIYFITIPYYDDAVGFLIDGVTYYSDPNWHCNGTCRTGTFIGPITPSNSLEFTITQGTGGGGIAVSMVLTTPSPLVDGGIINSAITNICQGGNLFTSNTSFTGVTTFSGGCTVGNNAYQWQSSFDGTSWNNLSGGIYANYLYNQSILQTTYFRRRVTDLCGNNGFSNVLTVSINFTGADPSVAGNNYWNAYYYYDQSLNATNGSGPLAGTYTMTGLNPTTTGYSFDTRNYYASGTSPSNAPGAQGCPITGTNISAKFLRTGFANGLYQFDVKYIDDQVWMFINNQLVNQQTACCVVVDNFFTTSLTGTDVVELRWAQGGGGSGLFMSITGPNLTVTSPIVGSVGPQVIVCADDIPTQTFITVTSTTGGCQIKNYQWQSSTIDGVSGFRNVLGGTSQSLNPGFTVNNTTWLRRIDTDWCGFVNTLTGALMTVTGTVPGDTSVFGNNQWLAYGFNSYTGNTVSQILDLSLYTNYRGFATITVPSFTSASYYNVSTQSTSYITGYNGCSILPSQHSTIVKRKGFPTGQYNIQFQYDDPGAVFVNGVAIYASPYLGQGFYNTGWNGNLSTNDKIELRQSQNNGNTLYGITLTPVTVTGVTSAGTIGGDQTVCYGTSGVVITSSGVATSGGCYVYYTWTNSTVAGMSSQITTLTGLTTLTSLTFTQPLYQTTYFKRLAVDACGSILGSNIVTVSINGIFLPGSINTVSGVCGGFSPSTITNLTLPSGGVGGYSYVWQYSPDNSTFTNIATATGANYTSPIAISSATYFRRSANSGSCGPVYSNSILASVNSNTSISTQPLSNTVCGSSALFTVAAGGVNPTYQWQISTTTGVFNTLTGPVYIFRTNTFTGVTSNSLLVSGNLVSVNGSNYRVLVNSGCGPLLTSTGTAALVVGTPAITTQPIGRSVCVGNQAVYNVAASSPALTIIWKESKDGGLSYNNISDNTTFAGTASTSLTVTGLSLSMSNNIYLSVLSTTCVTLTSSGAALTVTGTISTNTITGPVNVCPNTSASLSGLAPGGGGGTFTYQWQVSTISGSSGFVNGTGATATTINYTTPNLSLQSWFIRIATSSSGCQDISTALGVAINQATTSTIVTASLSSCLGTNISFTATAAGTGTLSYQWQEDPVGAATWYNLTNTGMYSGANSLSLSISGIVLTMAGNNYRLVVTSTVCGGATNSTNTRTISNVYSPIAIVGHPSDYLACSGSLSPTFIGSVTGSNLSYRWQVNTNGDGTSFADVGGVSPYNGGSVTTNTLLFATGVSINNPAYRFRLRASNVCSGNQFTNSALLSVTSAISGNSITANQNICVGVPAALVGNAPPALTGGDNNYAYNWQYSTDNVTFNNFTPTSVTSVNYSPSTLTGTTYFRRLVNTLDCALSTSNTLTIQVSPATEINTQPVYAGVCQGTNASFTLSASGSNVAYQWQYATTTVSGGNWVNVSPVISGVTHTYSSSSPALSITNPPLSFNNYQYRAIVSGDCGTSNVTSTGVALLVNPTPAFVTNPLSSISYCDGQTIAVNSSATGAGSVQYQWFQSTSGSGGTFFPVTTTGSFLGFTASSLTIVGATYASLGYAYRPVSFIGGCSVTGTVAATLNPGPNTWLGNSTNWFDPTNWCSGAVPVSGINISINTGASNYPVINAPGAIIGNLTLAGGSITVGTGNQLDITSNWVNNGGQLLGSGTVGFSGTSRQTIGGSTPTTFAGMSILNSVSGVALGVNQYVSGTLSFGPDNTNLTTTGFTLRLVSNSVTGTARIAAIPNPANSGIVGNITMQRFLPGKKAMRFFSPPVSGANLLQMKNFMYLTGPGGATNGWDASTLNLTTFFRYIEAVQGPSSFGFDAPTNANFPLAVGTGYKLFMRGDRSTSVNAPTSSGAPAGSTTFELTGTLNKGDIALPVSRNGNTTNDGWNLIGNPYPSEIMWNITSTSMWLATNIADEFYIWDPQTINTTSTQVAGSYFTYKNGISTPSRTNGNVIASSQAFFIRANGSSPSLTIRENAKVSATHSANFRKALQEDVVRVQVRSSNNVLFDEAVIRFNEDATLNFDEKYDAFKLANTALNISTKGKDQTSLVINGLPMPDTASIKIPLLVNSTAKTDYNLSLNALESLSFDADWYLKDNHLNTETPLNALSVYNFTIGNDTSTSSDKRFLIIVKKRFVPKVEDETDTVTVPITSTPGGNLGNNGNVTDSVSITNESPLGDIKTAILAPNPWNGKENLQIFVRGIENQEVVVEISDLNGHVIHILDSYLKDGSVSLEKPELSSGAYIITISVSNSEKVFKLVRVD